MCKLSQRNVPFGKPYKITWLPFGRWEFRYFRVFMTLEYNFLGVVISGTGSAFLLVKETENILVDKDKCIHIHDPPWPPPHAPYIQCSSYWCYLQNTLGFLTLFWLGGSCDWFSLSVSYVTVGDMRASKMLFAMSLHYVPYSSCFTNLSPRIEPHGDPWWTVEYE